MDTIVSLSPPVLRLPLAITITTTTSRHLLPPAAASSSGSSLRLLIKQRSSSSIIGNHSPPARQRSVLLSSRASASSSVSTATVAVASAQKEKEKDLVFVAGATGRVGSRAVREFIKLGFRVRAAVRNTQRATSLVQSVQQLKQDAAAELELVECDLEKQAQEGIVSAIGNASLVVCSIGASEKEILDVTGPYRVDYMATNKLVQAASAAKVEHFILVTSLGTNKIGFPAFLLNLFWGVLYWKRRAEEALIASGIPYTIIRPGGMERPTDAFKETHNLVLAPEDTYVGGQVSNLQVAELIGCINSNRRAAYCKIMEVVAETTAPLLPMEQLLSAIPSNREPPPPPPAADADDEPPMVDPDPDLEPAHDGDGDGAQDVVAPESRPRRIALFVEPSPFAYVSGYKNRFQNFIKYLREMGDEVIVVTTHEGVPQEFHGAKLIGSWSFPCPWYQKVPLSLALSPRIIGEVARFKPDIIHASSPGIMVFGALIIAKLLCVPLVMSYHTHVPIYIPRYTFSWLVKPMWLIIKFLHRAADLTLVPSIAIGRDLEAARVTAANKIRLWNKGVDSESFHPRFRNMQMRSRLTNGEPEKPLIFYVGRLGVEKSLDFLKRVMDRLPGARIAFIGDGPFRAELEQMFSGMLAVFTGTLQGQELSQAYASGDVFVMPSESETLGFVVLEAMSSGVPVVGARAGGIPDIIPEDQEGKTSFLYTPGDVNDCVGKIEQLLSSEELREAMGRAARKEMEKFDWQAATRKIRNEQYSAAIWFWRKKRALLLRPLRWVLRLLRPRMPGAANADAVAKQS